MSYKCHRVCKGVVCYELHCTIDLEGVVSGLVSDVVSGAVSDAVSGAVSGMVSVLPVPPKGWWI